MATSWKVSRAFMRQFSSNPFAPGAQSGDPGKLADMWMKIFFFVAMPCLGLGMLNTYLKTKEEEANWVRPEFVPYDCVRIRTKRYPWGDGTRTLFHNPHVNPLPTGWEDEH